MRTSAEHPLASGAVPRWAIGIGDDRFGAFADLQVRQVRVRLRWVPGGRFLMGSPEGEAGRFENELLHPVELSGYWLGETPVTQALWQVVMGKNPSQFVHAERPVDTVSWDECQGFVGRLNALVPGLAAALPTEAQWEFACRAGETTATYEGDLEILGERHAPVLDAIAWYGGNSGVDFDLEGGGASSSWPEKQYPHTRTGTRIVSQKQPNGLGLFDMLGNVFEWCFDWIGPYSSALQRDPRGSKSGGSRVLRGGSWFSVARNVRAANRSGDPPDYRYDDLGCRLSRGQE